METVDDIFRELAGEFDASLQVKALIAGCYHRDGDDLLESCLYSWGSPRNNRSYRSKLFTLARMAIECYLKSLIVTYSPESESPEDAYKSARNSSHSLKKLAIEALARINWNKPFLRKATIEAINEIDALPVSLRYEIDMTAAFFQETFEEQMRGSGKMSKTIGSDEWFQELHQHVAYLAEKARNAFDQRMGDHTGHLLSDAKARDDRIQQFMQNVNIL